MIGNPIENNQYWRSTIELLEKYKDRVEDMMKSNLGLDSNIIKDTTFHLNIGDDYFEITFKTKYYYYWLEHGRGPTSKGKHVPFAPIAKWVERKNIVPWPNKYGRIPTPRELPWMICKKIDREGYEGYHYKKDIQDNLFSSLFEEELANALTEDISRNIDYILFDIPHTTTIG